MTCLRLALVAVLTTSACMTGDDTVNVAGGERAASYDERSDVTSDSRSAPADPDVCTLLPPDGPCSLACDPEALAEQFVPLGTCAAFACTLVDGRQITVHACHPAPS